MFLLVHPYNSNIEYSEMFILDFIDYRKLNVYIGFHDL